MITKLNNNISIVCISTKDNPFLQTFINSLPAGCECIIMFNKENKEKANQLTFINETNLNCHIKYYMYYYDEFSFSKLRNVAKSKATKEWIISLDTDERITLYQDDYDMLNQMPDNIGGLYNITTCLKSDGSFENIKQVRIFRNKAHFVWTKYVHEQIANSIKKNGYDLALSSIQIRHEGYVDQRDMPNKMLRNIKLGIKDLNNEFDKLSLFQMYHSLGILNKSGYFK